MVISLRDTSSSRARRAISLSRDWSYVVSTATALLVAINYDCPVIVVATHQEPALQCCGTRPTLKRLRKQEFAFSKQDKPLARLNPFGKILAETLESIFAQTKRIAAPLVPIADSSIWRISEQTTGVCLLGVITKDGVYKCFKTVAHWSRI
jgi:hypothetical protein